MEENSEKQFVRIISIVALGGTIIYRWESIFGEKPTTIDIFTVSLLAVLILYPLFKEISIGSISIKKEIENTKKEINGKIDQLKIDMIATQTFNPTINFQNPGISDKAIDQVTKDIGRSVSDAIAQFAVKELKEDELGKVDSQVEYVFKTRYLIEKELRRLWNNLDFQYDKRRIPSIYEITNSLAKSELIPFHFVNSIKDIYSICSPVIHGEEIDDKRMQILKEYAPKIISTLKEIENLNK